MAFTMGALSGRAGSPLPGATRAPEFIATTGETGSPEASPARFESGLARGSLNCSSFDKTLGHLLKPPSWPRSRCCGGFRIRWPNTYCQLGA